MNALNQIIIEGNVVRQPEKKEFQNGIKVCTVPIAVNRYYKTQNGQSAEEVSFFDISTFGQLADACEKWCPKGRGIRVVGRLKQDSWKNEEGKTRTKISIIAEHVEFKPFFKKNDSGSEESAGGPGSADREKASPSKKQKLAMLAEAAEAAQHESEDEIEF